MREEYTEPEFETKRVGEIPAVEAFVAGRRRATRRHGAIESVRVEVPARNGLPVAREQARDRCEVA